MLKIDELQVEESHMVGHTGTQLDLLGGDHA